VAKTAEIGGTKGTHPYRGVPNVPSAGGVPFTRLENFRHGGNIDGIDPKMYFNQAREKQAMAFTNGAQRQGSTDLHAPIARDSGEIPHYKRK
tara:strand:- start:3023 stop:3298 length:276 start_codon:yes stop_codon:yes gene_type:complete